MSSNPREPSLQDEDGIGEHLSEGVERIEEGLSDFEHQLLREVRSLHEHLDQLERKQRAYVVSRHHWLGHLIKDLEYNPSTQYKIHITAAWFWIANLVIVLIVQFVFPDQWALIAVLYVAIVSLYANLATDYGAASAALAAMERPPLPEIPGEPAARFIEPLPPEPPVAQSRT
jgi:hypothetical protein